MHSFTYSFILKVFYNDVIKTSLFTDDYRRLITVWCDWNSALWMTPLISGDVVC